jgi:hypothetical protein
MQQAACLARRWLWLVVVLVVVDVGVHCYDGGGMSCQVLDGGGEEQQLATSNYL